MKAKKFRVDKLILCCFLLLVCLFSSLIIPALGEESAIWMKTYGGSNNDDCFSVLESNDGGYILAGDTASFGAGETDVWLIKTDVNGNMEWNKTYGGAASDDVQFMISDDYGYVIAGRTASFGSGDSMYSSDPVGHLFTHSGSPLHRSQISAFSLSFIASYLQTSTHNPQAMHF